MKIQYWNINNNRNTFKKILDSLSDESISICGFSEYWNIFSEIDTTIMDYNILTDPVHKRNGIILQSSIIYKTLAMYKYYIKLSIKNDNIDFILYVVHGKSQLYSESDSSRITESISYEIVDDIKDNNYEYVLIIGDFNKNYNHENFINSYCLNTTNYFNEKESTYKVIEGEKYLKFYNPIAALHGDLSPGAIGTYYYTKQTVSQSWLIFDIALVSYPLSKYLKKDGIKIINNIGDTLLVTQKGLPDKKFSDHLPIVLELL